MNQPALIIASVACVVTAAVPFLAAFLTHCARIRRDPLPARGDATEAWLTAERDACRDRYGFTPTWYAIDGLLYVYRLHADTATPLSEHACAGNGCVCERLEVRP